MEIWILKHVRFVVILLAIALLTSYCTSDKANKPRFYIPVSVNRSTVKTSNTPCEVEVDFADLLKELDEPGVFDPHSVVVEGKDSVSGEYMAVDYRVDERYKYSSKGKISWNIKNPAMTEFRLFFDTKTDSPRKPRAYIPAIGVGDEIMFNTSELVPLVPMSGNVLTDFNSDGITDNLQINHYSDRYGWPYDGILFHPGIKEDDHGIVVRDFYRLRFIPKDATKDDFRFLHSRYNWIFPVDWDEDGFMDLFYISMNQIKIDSGVTHSKSPFPSSDHITFLKNTGSVDISGLPILKEAKHYPAQLITDEAYVPTVAAEDFDGDGRRDLLGVRTNFDGIARSVTVYFYRNIGNDNHGIPRLAEPALVQTKDGKPLVGHVTASHVVSFGDVNGDEKIDIIYSDINHNPPETYWHKNMGGSPPVFGKNRNIIEGLPFEYGGYRWSRWNGKEGLLSKENSDLFVRTVEDDNPVFVPAGGLRETYAPLVGGMQEIHEWIDWDSDGDMDLISGEARGRIHLYKNIGTSEYPKFKNPEWVQANGEQIRIYRDGVFGGKHWHGAMGYPSIACTDWDLDGLFDLIIPNETNRVYWYRNIGKRGEPEFGIRRQILPDGFTDSPDRLEQTRRAAFDPKRENHPYPLEKDIPFFWRTRLAIADYTGDGLDDLIALNGMRNLVLYERYLDSNGKPKLRHGEQLFFDTGDPIERTYYYKLRNVDWNGDGLIDIVVTQNLFSEDKRTILFFKNVGAPEMPVFERPRAFRMWNDVITYSSHGLQPSFIDWDGDGSLDFVGCNESGLFVLFRNAVLTGEKPRVTAGIPAKR